MTQTVAQLQANIPSGCRVVNFWVEGYQHPTFVMAAGLRAVPAGWDAITLPLYDSAAQEARWVKVNVNQIHKVHYN